MTKLVYDLKKVTEYVKEFEVLDTWDKVPSNALFMVDIDLNQKPFKVKFFRIIGRKADQSLVVTSDKRLLSDVTKEFFAEFNKVLKSSDVYNGMHGETPSAPEIQREVPQESNSAIESNSVEVSAESQSPLDVDAQVAVKDPSQNSTQALLTKKPQKEANFFDKLFGKKPKNVSKILFYGENDDIEYVQKRIRATIPGAESIEMMEFITLNSLIDTINVTNNFILMTDKRKLSATQTGIDLLNIMSGGGVIIAEFEEIRKMNESELISLIQNVKDISIQHVLYNKQRVIMFINATGGVGKTTLSLNFANWLASRSATVMYMEIIGSSGIDDLIKTKSIKIDDIFDDNAEPTPVPVDQGKIAYISLLDSSKGSISQGGNWKRMWDKYIDWTKQPAMQYHAILVDTYTHMISTRYLLNYATDIIVVNDMRETTESMTKNTVDSLMSMMGDTAMNKNFFFVTNFYKESAKNEDRYQRVKAETNAIAETHNMKIRFIRVPWVPESFGNINIEDVAMRKMILNDLVREIYGIKA